MRVCLLASGSRGNSTLIESGDSRLLIDAGLSGKQTRQRLAELGLSCDDLDAILVTHEHHDHVGGVGPLARRHQLPVFIDDKTCAALPKLGHIPQLRRFDAGDSFSFRDLQISTFSTTHDAVNPIGFSVASVEGKIGYATDLGHPTRLVSESLKQCRVLVLEANHDEDMLQNSSYPWGLKQRIRSRHGHLSNVQAGQLLEDIHWPGLEALLLAHLSDENNCSQLVAAFFRNRLTTQGCTAQLIIGSQSKISTCFSTVVTAEEQVY